MLINLKRKILFFGLLAIAFSSYAGDTLHVNSFNTFRLLRAENAWLWTGNVAGLVFNQPKSRVNFETGMNQGDGDFHRIREAKSYNNYSVSTESFQSLKNRFYLYGRFAYNYIDENGGQWNGTYDPYNGNPYILADSVSGMTYHKENYNLVGGVGYKLNDRITLGCGLDYYVGVGAKQKDPRPQNTYVRFSINPSLIFSRPGYKLGVDLGFKNGKEEITYDVFRNNYSPSFFMFKGFGFFNKEIDLGYYRFLTVNDFFGGIQLEKKLLGLPTLTELRFDYNTESIEDGGSVIRKLDGGDWQTYNVLLKEQIAIRKGLSRQYFKALFSFFNGDGNEFLQNVVYEGTWNVPRYVTIGENLKFNRQTLNGTINYSYFRMKDTQKVNWNVDASVNYLNNNEYYYYIPEVFSSGYTNINGNLTVQKNLYFGKCHLALALNSGYTSNLSNELQLSTLPEITKKQRKDVYQQEFDFYTSSLFKAGGEIKLGGSFLKFKNAGQIYLSIRYDDLKQTNGNQDFRTFSTKLGFVF
jgi:hypothetical protein